MIVKNEEAVIGRCLTSVQNIVDEVIIVDTGSTDRTKEICCQFTSKLHNFTWIDNFAAARNFAFSLATMDYILWLDADDVLLEADRRRFLTLKETLDPAVDSVTMPYHLSFDQHGQVTSSLRRNRLVKRVKNFTWIGAVHEYLAVHGHIINGEVAITHQPLSHDTNRNIEIYDKRLAAGEDFSPRDLYYYANELRDHRRYPESIEYYQKFLATNQGWVEDNIAACGKLADCYAEQNDRANSVRYMFESFKYDTPRAEFCCRLGYHHMQDAQYKQAVFWYKLATQLEKPSESWGTVNHACWTWLPHLQLCVCYDRLGRHVEAHSHNEAAATFIPDDPKIAYNRQYFQRLLFDKK
jgi:glycosyltransferase involved in cell wall biosynthesis